jgi:hypothetical protein
MTRTPDASASAATRRGGVVLAALGVLALALVFRTGLVGLTPVFDEYYHLLAARGWLETGRPTILDGEYVRVSLFTGAVAWLFDLTGRATLETGRLLAVVAGVLIPVVLFLWLRARAGWIAALIGAGLAVLWPQGIEEAQILRFYSWQVLTFLVGAIAAFEAVAGRGPARAGWAIFAAAALGAALYIQLTTAIGLAAILAWIGLAVVLPAAWAHPARWRILGGLALAGLAVLGLLVWSGALAEGWSLYRWSAAWNAHRQNEVTYYHDYLRGTYPTLWPLFPLAALIAYRRLPGPTLYAALLFGAIFLGQSFGGMKAVRYLSYGMPFFFAVWALAAAAALPALGAALMRAAEAANPTGRRAGAAALVAAAALFAAFANPFFGQSIDAAFGQPPSGRAEPDWRRMPDLVGDWADVPFRMTMRELHTVAALGDYDVVIGDDRLEDFPGAEEFFLDPRTGRPMIDELASVARILACEDEGLLLADGRWWGDREETWLPLFEAAGRDVEIRTERRLFALRWSGGSADPAACAALPL